MRKKSFGWIAVVMMLVFMVLLCTACGKQQKNDENTGKETTTEDREAKKQETTTQDRVSQETGTVTEDATTQEQGTTEAEKKIVLDESKAVSVWTTASLNLRKVPNTSGEVRKVLAKGTEIKKYDETDGWALVKSGDTVGYVSIKYLADKKPEEKKEETAASGQTASKVEAIPGQHRNPNSAIVVIDPGHQRKGDSTKEPNGPGSSVMKARVTYGATGVATGVTEYVLNLDVSLKLRAELENRGYTVYMTRTTHDVNISNMERAQYGNSVGADVVVRVHANSASGSARGAETICPSTSNPYVSHLAAASKILSKCVIDEYCKATGFKNRGVKTDDTMTGINWSEIPVTIIELGFLSNEEEDRLMQDANMQNNMVQGIANGLDQYFGF